MTNMILGIYSRKMKTLLEKDTCTSMFIAALFTVTKICKQPKLSINRWMHKEDVDEEDIQRNIPQPLKTSEILLFAITWRKLEGIMLHEISQRKTNTVCFPLYV